MCETLWFKIWGSMNFSWTRFFNVYFCDQSLFNNWKANALAICQHWCLNCRIFFSWKWILIMIESEFWLRNQNSHLWNEFWTRWEMYLASFGRAMCQIYSQTKSHPTAIQRSKLGLSSPMEFIWFIWFIWTVFILCCWSLA